MRIAVLPVGRVQTGALDFVQSGLRAIFPETEVTLTEYSMTIPKQGYDLSRRQYYSTLVLTEMANYAKSIRADYILGMTEADLFAPNLNFVFGEAICPGRVALVSLFRLKPEFYGKKKDRQLFYGRALKEAVHELGHALGLKHCPNPSCIMFFSSSIMDTDRKETKFCDDCHLLVHRALER